MAIKIHHGRTETSFAKPQKRAVVRDRRLSWAARGFFCFIDDLPDDWLPSHAHLEQMSDLDGRTSLRTILKELKVVGALSISVHQITAEEAQRLTVEKGKQFKEGQLYGHDWVIHHPDEWASEAPLDPAAEITNPERRETRRSGIPTVGKPPTKGLLSKGSPIEGVKERGGAAAPSRQRRGRSDPLVSEEGITYKPGDARDEAKLKQIRRYQPGHIRQAVVEATEMDGCSWPSRVLSILKALPEQPTPTNQTIQDWEPPEVRSADPGGGLL